MGDSKKIFPGKGGFQKLEKTVLAFHWAVHQELPQNLRDWVFHSPIPTNKSIWKQHPWYRKLDLTLPVKHDPDEIKIWGERLLDLCKKKKVTIESVGSFIIPEKWINQSLHLTQNKSITHFEMCSKVLCHLTDHYFENGGNLRIDHLGMRQRYLDLLLPLFPDSPPWILKETKDESIYRINVKDRPTHISFVTRGDNKHFTIALASLFAKYSRELLMKKWNQFFSKIAPTIQPTAGYYSDAKRYLKEARKYLKKAGYDEKELVRVR